jgi:heme/copper-type cytochrome/quinol oxidase subunit 2
MCEGDGKRTRGLLFVFFISLITFGIYFLFWIFFVGDRLQDNAVRYSLKFKEGGTTVLLWYILGSFIIIGPLVAMYIIFKNTNALADEYNKSH